MTPSPSTSIGSQAVPNQQPVLSIDPTATAPVRPKSPVAWLWIVVGAAMMLGATPAIAANWATGKNRFNLNSHIGFNINADLTGLGGVPAQTDIGLERRRENHYYDDGFNLIDEIGNADGRTSFWGYASKSQIVGDTVLMNSTSVPTTSSTRSVSDAPHWGAELSYARELGWDGSYWWGVEIGLSWVNLNFSARDSITSDAIRTTDTYSLGGIGVPEAPYTGTFADSGLRISDQPVRSVQTLNNAAITHGSYDLDAQLYALRLGLIYETPFTDWFTLQFGGGVIGGFIQSDFSYRESTSVPGIRTEPQIGSDRERDFLGGAYARAGFGIHFSPYAMASLGLQYNHLGTFSQHLDGRSGKIDLRSALFVGAGFGVSF